MTRHPFPSVIDNSMLSAFKACPRNWFWQDLRRIELEGGNLHLITGGAYAAGLEAARRAYYEQHTQADHAIALGLEALIRFYGTYEPPADHVKSFSATFHALIDYFMEYPLETDPFVPIELSPGRRAIEFTFAIPLPINNPDTGEPLLYSGRFDALGTFNGLLFGLDDKTTSRLGPSWTRNWTLDSQFTGYTWALREHGKTVAGFLVRGISFLKDKYGHVQAVVYRPDWQIDRWYEHTLFLVRQMIAFHQENYYPMMLDKHSCNSYGGCQYSRLCESRDPARWIELDYVPRVWNPLHKGTNL